MHECVRKISSFSLYPFRPPKTCLEQPMCSGIYRKICYLKDKIKFYIVYSLGQTLKINVILLNYKETQLLGKFLDHCHVTFSPPGNHKGLLILNNKVRERDISRGSKFISLLKDKRGEGGGEMDRK